MPIAFDPENDRIDVHLDCIDAGKPDAERATFVCRPLTIAQEKRVAGLLSEALRQPSAAEVDVKLNEALKLGVVGWRNLRDHAGAEVPFGDAALEEFTMRAKVAIVREYPLRLLLTSAEGKR